MNATEASRRFASVLDLVEHGESIVVTRSGRRLALIQPIPPSNGAELNMVLATQAVDDGFVSDIEATRSLLTKDVSAAWPDA